MADVSSSLGGPVLVTGGSGFVGASVVRRLVSEDRPTIALVRPGTKFWRIDDIRDRLVVQPIDLRNAGAVSEFIESARPSAIVHLAAYGSYADQTCARTIFETNIIGTLNVIEAAQKARVRLVVNVGSSSEYGRKTVPMREDDIAIPDRPYGIAKLAQSLLGAMMGRQGPTAIATLRLFTVYGPYERSDRLIPKIVLGALDGFPLVMSSPEVSRDFIFIDDVVDILLSFDRLADHSGEIVNVGTGRQTSFGELVSLVLETTGGRSSVEWSTQQLRPWDSKTWVADTSKFQAFIDRAPLIDLRAGLSRYVQWARMHRSVYADE